MRNVAGPVELGLGEEISIITEHVLEIWICGCSLFYKRELWAIKSVGAKGHVPKIYGFVHPC